MGPEGDSSGVEEVAKVADVAQAAKGEAGGEMAPAQEVPSRIPEVPKGPDIDLVTMTR